MGHQVGATFVPGGFDDYYMPEVVAPSPQRVTPQVPQNMQEDLRRLESGTRATADHETQESVSHQVRDTPPSNTTALFQFAGADPSATKEDVICDVGGDVAAYQASESRSQRTNSSWKDSPSFSPFPKVSGDNVPPANDAKEEILWNARKHVLHSQDVTMQISWARDVLTWADIAADALTREYIDRTRPATPRIEHELRLDALNIINYLAEQEHPDALYIRSKWLEFGKFGHRIDRREAYNGYQRAAELGHVRSEYRMGMLFEQSNDILKAKDHYYRGMNLQDSAALYRMGMMSLLGQHGESRDYTVGIERIHAAANSSDEDAPQGSYVYGMLVGRDLPDISIPDGLLPFNQSTAKTYVEKAAYLGFAKAQLKMGQAYELCQLSCDFEPSLSLHYYGLAAKQGLPEAALGVSRWFLFGYEGLFEKNEELAFRYAQEAAALKLPTGEFAMGYYYEIGIHVSRSISDARAWYQLAADHGNQDAMDRLESLSHDQNLSEIDHKTTTLTRIKSQHGSQRGKRPDRFRQSQQMPTVNEILPDSAATRNASSYIFPGSSQTMARPSSASESNNAPDRSSFEGSMGTTSSAGTVRPPAFTVKLDGAAPLPVRSMSAAPYPDDDRPAPLTMSRPHSTAPYPEDDVRAPSVSRHGAGFQSNQGLQVDRPSSAFGIQTLANGIRSIPMSHSTGSLQPPKQAGPQRGRVMSAGWEFQGSGAGARHQSPGPGFKSQRAFPVEEAYSQVYGAHAWSAAEVGLNKPQKQTRPPYTVGHSSASQSVHEASSWHDPESFAQDHDRRSKTTGRLATSNSAAIKDRPGQGSQSAATVPTKPTKGPATFEDMGIPQGKQGGDCVVM